ncbi:MAG: GNAT family N-acetyltransferase [Planctomycetota bacterium]
MLRDSDAFNEDEVRVALEVLDVYLGSGKEAGLGGDYPHLVARERGAAVGYVCIGKTPMTLCTFHLYWICVARSVQRSGLGRALMQAAEEFARERGGERVVVETAGKASYQGTRQFYRDLGYAEAACIADYYAPGDALHVFVKRLRER